MKIAIIGYGKMGKDIAVLLSQLSYVSLLFIDNEEDWKQHEAVLSNCDVAIEFSTPATVIQNLKRCIEKQIPVVTGTTGWGESLDEIIGLAEANNVSLIYGSNFSIGANLFFDLIASFSKVMKEQEAYSVSIEETHHSQKKDRPSGTAITIAETILHESDNLNEWQLEEEDEESDNIILNKGTIPIKSYRFGDVAGVHCVLWKSVADTIELTHSADNRSGFAQGAIRAAFWLLQHPGIYNFKDIYKQI